MVRSWRSDRKLIIATVLLLFAEVIGLLMHLRILPSPFQTEKKQFDQQPAGHVLKAQKELRKRGLNSLIWENAETEETVYYYDSILTLSQSSATLYLTEKTEVHLSENTLVTIEPPNSSTDSQIRLKFTRGDLRARNPYVATKIETDEWSLNLSQGSEVSLKQTGKDDFEVEVLKGELQFEKDSQKQSLSENQVLKIDDNQVAETLKVASDLQFQGPAYERIYAHQAEALIPIQWQGEAEQIQVLPIGEEQFTKTISKDQKEDFLNLAPGKYSLRLAHQGQVSEAKEIEIWPAPTLHLLSPFPRDRVKTNENISFIWSYLKQAQEYQLVLTDRQTGAVTKKTLKENSVQFPFSEEADFQWKVIGLDQDGFEMPSSYANDLFLRHEPFAAPLLKSPRLRAPASPDKNKSQEKTKPGAFLQPKRIFWWSLLTSSIEARASSSSPQSSNKLGKVGDYEAIFEWEPVPNADIYTIEISATADFRSPVVTKTISKTNFVWTQFELGTYYWRVAAGSSSGRMGLFSEPAKAQLEQSSQAVSNQDGVIVRKKPEPEKKKAFVPERAPIVTSTEEIFKNAPPVAVDNSHFEKETILASENYRNLQENYLFEWSPAKTSLLLHGENGLKLKLNGSTLGSFYFQTEQIYADRKTYMINISYSQYLWKIGNEHQYPEQDDQFMPDLKVQILLGDHKSSIRRGALLQLIPLVQRVGLEKIKIKSVPALGPSVYFTGIDGERLQSGHAFSLVAGEETFAVSSQNDLRYFYWKGEKNSFSFGLKFQADAIFNSNRFSNGWSTGVSLGFEHK